jgi:hypothetical protein
MLINNKIFFIHIPRTAGRYVKTLFKNNSDICEFYLFDELFKGVVIGHLHYPYYEQLFNFKNVIKLTVVREPVDRFISILSTIADQEWFLKNKIFKNQNSFNEFVNEKVINSDNNWFRPQVNFIDNETKIWKYENGFGNSFVNWIKEISNFEIKNKVNLKHIFKTMDYDNKKKIILSEKEKNLIKNYYYQDYKILEYEFK